jgi:hypothetical protein
MGWKAHTASVTFLTHAAEPSINASLQHMSFGEAE